MPFFVSKSISGDPDYRGNRSQRALCIGVSPEDLVREEHDGQRWRPIELTAALVIHSIGSVTDSYLKPFRKTNMHRGWLVQFPSPCHHPHISRRQQMIQLSRMHK